MMRRTAMLGLVISCAVLSLGTMHLKADDLTDRDIAGRPYRPVSQLSGEVKVVGSGLLGHLLTLWSDEFRGYQPKVKFEIACVGSETALPELAGDGIVLGAMSRPLTKVEKDAFETKSGKRIHVIAVCEDQLAAIVHKDNPIDKMTGAQFRAMFASKESDADKKLTWGDMGLSGTWSTVPVTGHGRSASSGTRAYLKGLLVSPGFKERAQKEHPSSKEMIDAVAADKGGIGYCRPAMISSGVKPVTIVNGAVELKAIKRLMYLVVSAPKDKAISPVAMEFLLFGLSQTGQNSAIKDGFTPLERTVLQEQLDKLGIKPIK